MTSPKALGTKRGVPALRVRKAWASYWKAMDETVISYTKVWAEDKPVIVIENPPPGLNCAKLKKLVEIAADGDIHQRLMNMESAIKWALGEMGEFSPREVGMGAYWWRNELRRIAFGDRCLTQPKPKRTGRNGGRKG